MLGPGGGGGRLRVVGLHDRKVLLLCIYNFPERAILFLIYQRKIHFTSIFK